MLHLLPTAFPTALLAALFAAFVTRGSLSSWGMPAERRKGARNHLPKCVLKDRNTERQENMYLTGQAKGNPMIYDPMAT